MKELSNKTVQGSNTNMFLKVLQYVVFSSIILYFGRTLLIPLSFSLLISFILYPICKWLERHGISRTFAILISILLLVLLLTGIIILLINQFMQFREMWPQMKQKLIEGYATLTTYISQHFNITIENQEIWLKKTAGDFTGPLISYFSAGAFAFSVSLVMLLLIPIISALILLSRSVLVTSLFDFFPDYNKNVILKLIHDTIHSYYNFIKGMLLVYLIVGILNSIGLAIVGVPNPVLFGFIASILTFIPYVGILIAALLPITVTWITFNSMWYPVGVIIVFSIVQYLEANIIFPFAVSNKLNLNMLATIIAILIGGLLWGAAGMILFVPFLSILKLVADKSENMKSLANLLGTKPDAKKRGLFH